jgi:predicted Fe-Mo cluster-binding NifX family protein/predicted DNA-binding protein (UPF0251 family)
VRELERVLLSFDELEALRLLHLEKLTQAEAGKKLGVSGSTVSRMAERAHHSLTEALVVGKAVCIGSGPVTVVRIEENAVPTPSEATQPADILTRGVKMIVAVPYLQGEVNAHFGSTQAFLIAETSEEKVIKTSVYEVQGMQHNHAGIAGFLKEQGVQVILAGGMGAPMQQALKLQGFELYCGVSGPAVEAIEALLRGELPQSDTTCGHHHGEHL